MKRIKINFAILAVLLGVSTAFAFKAPAASKDVDVEWVRTGSESVPEGNTWLQQTSGSCEDATRICKATFASGYNPNMHTYAENVTNKTNTIVDLGYVPQP